MSYAYIVYSYTVADPWYLYTLIVDCAFILCWCICCCYVVVDIVTAINSSGKVTPIKVGYITVVSEAP